MDTKGFHVGILNPMLRTLPDTVDNVTIQVVRRYTLPGVMQVILDESYKTWERMGRCIPLM